MYYIKREIIKKNIIQNSIVDQFQNIVENNILTKKVDSEVGYYKVHPTFEGAHIYSPFFDDKSIFNTEKEANDKLSLLMSDEQNHQKLYPECDIRYTVETIENV